MRSWGPAAQVSAFPAPEPSRLAGHEQLGVPLPGETATSTPVEPSASALGAEDRSIGRSRSLRAPHPATKNKEGSTNKEEQATRRMGCRSPLEHRPCRAWVRALPVRGSRCEHVRSVTVSLRLHGVVRTGDGASRSLPTRGTWLATRGDVASLGPIVASLVPPGTSLVRCVPELVPSVASLVLAIAPGSAKSRGLTRFGRTAFRSTRRSPPSPAARRTSNTPSTSPGRSGP